MVRAEHAASYYAASANPSPEHPVLRGEARCDACIVGAGFTGLSAALHLAERGYSVIVLEAARVGWGASGRNGGQVIVGFAQGMSRVEKRAGSEHARRLWQMSLEAVAIVHERVARHGIRCDLKPGYLLAAHKRGDLRWMAAEVAKLSDEYGYAEARLVSRGEIAEMVATKRYHGAMLDTRSGHLHPLNYALGLAAAAAAAGARVFEGSRVVRLDAGGEPAAHTAEGVVRARHVLLCANAYLGRLAPSIAHRIMPVGTFIAATEPLGEERARALIRDDVAVCDSKFVLDYYRLSADHRLLFGGGVSYSGRVPRRLAASQRRRMLRTFPQLAEVAIDYAWGGDVAITTDRLPHFGRHGPSVFFAHGYSGQGVALAQLGGRLLAEAVAGTAERFDVFARLEHKAFPGGPWRMPALVLATLYFRLRDWL